MSTTQQAAQTENSPPNVAQSNEKYMTAAEAAEYLRLSTSTLAKRRLTGDGPLLFKLGRKVTYSKSALDNWVTTRIRQSTSDTSTARGRPR
jgi:excisionase family DNA binding protein